MVKHRFTPADWLTSSDGVRGAMEEWLAANHILHTDCAEVQFKRQPVAACLLRNDDGKAFLDADGNLVREIRPLNGPIPYQIRVWRGMAPKKAKP